MACYLSVFTSVHIMFVIGVDVWQKECEEGNAECKICMCAFYNEKNIFFKNFSFFFLSGSE